MKPSIRSLSKSPILSLPKYELSAGKIEPPTQHIGDKATLPPIRTLLCRLTSRNHEIRLSNFQALSVLRWSYIHRDDLKKGTDRNKISGL